MCSVQRRLMPFATEIATGLAAHRPKRSRCSRARERRAPFPIFATRTDEVHEAMDTEIFEFRGGIELPPVPPGKTLAAELSARDLTPHALALKLRVPPNRISDIVRGYRAISRKPRCVLGATLKTGAQFWLNLQTNYDLAVARQEFGDAIDREVEEAA